MKRVALYVRVSTEEQKKHGLSVDSQIVALRQWVQEHGYIEAGLYNDAGISARSKYTKRPSLLQLIDDCKAGKIDLIAFTKLDRWFRSVSNYYSVQSILDSCGVPWRAIWEDYETETSAGMFKVNIMLSVAQAESDRTSERIKAIFDYKRSQGLYISAKVPYGYICSKGVISKNEVVAEKVNLIFEKYASNYNLYETVKYAKEIGAEISRCTVRRMISNPIYAGETSDGFRVEPYITSEQYKRNVNSLGGRTKNLIKHDSVYIFQGILRCAECGSRYKCATERKVGKDRAGNPTEHLYIRYACCGHVNGNCSNGRNTYEKPLEKLVIAHIDSELERYTIESSMNTVDVDVEAEIEKLKNRLKRIGDRYEDGDISREEYHEKRASVLDSIAKLRNINTSAPQPLPADWLDIYNTLDASHKRAFWKSIIKSIELSSDRSKPPRITFL